MLGTHLGPYEITGELGRGGMGEVYRATDSKLGREVAVKVLPVAFTEDTERLARFEREARLLAQLQHSNIASIYGIEESGGVRALIMELVEGPTLDEWLQRGPLPLERSLDIARQIAEALEEAHAKGIVHRDLKPQNVKATEDGSVKVLDFGLAKAADPTTDQTTQSELEASPTLSLAATVQGVILGTAAYMAPEQAKGRAVDKRADIWAFGVVLYEMLTGSQLFQGSSLSEILAEVLKGEIDLDRLPPPTPPAIRRLLRRCLERNLKNRLHDIADARLVLEDVRDRPEEDLSAAPREPRTPRLVTAVGIVVGGAGLAALAFLAGRSTPRDVPREPVRFEVAAPEGTRLRSFDEVAAPVTISPDGRQLVFGVTEPDGSNRLWLRSLDEPTPRPLPGTERGSRPFWSPDSKSVAFFSSSELLRVELDGSPPQPICPVVTGRGGTWSAEGTIVFAPAAASALLRVPATGGKPEPVTTLRTEVKEVSASSHRYPDFLPDGNHFTYLALIGAGATGTGAESGNRLMLGSLDGEAPRVLAEGTSHAIFAAGHLVFRRGQALLARPFDPGRLEFVGSAVTLAEAVQYDAAYERALFFASDDVLAYQQGSYRGGTEFQLRDRSGAILQSFPSLNLQQLRFSPDGRRLAARAIETQAEAIHIIDMDQNRVQRQTLGEGLQANPVWSPDGQRLAYASSTGSSYRTEILRTDGDGAPEVLFDEEDVYPLRWASGGRFLVVSLGSLTGATFDIGLFDFDHPETGPAPLLAATNYDETLPAVSPDDRWLAYTSNETGRFEVYLTRFPSAEGKWLVSSGGGLDPVWDGRRGRLLYRNLGFELMEVPVDLSTDTPGIGVPVELFPLATYFDPDVAMFDLSPDGEILAVSVLPENELHTPITVVIDWSAGLR